MISDEAHTDTRRMDASLFINTQISSEYLHGNCVACYSAIRMMSSELQRGSSSKFHRVYLSKLSSKSCSPMYGNCVNFYDVFPFLKCSKNEIPPCRT